MTTNFEIGNYYRLAGRAEMHYDRVPGETVWMDPDNQNPFEFIGRNHVGAPVFEWFGGIRLVAYGLANSLMVPFDLHIVENWMRNVEIVSICDVVSGTGDWESMNAELETYLAENPNTVYYAAPREDFSLWTARDLAAALGAARVVVEDLS